MWLDCLEIDDCSIHLCEEHDNRVYSSYELPLVVKKSCVVNVGKEKVSMNPFLRYYVREVHYAMGNGKQEKKSINSIVFKQDSFCIC